ncbi:hypothetical protein [Maricaulis sp.]|uniref:hypothetical protein n=1 Tax=Maricaulis sp. TaxID=1486257 RepID=UPI003A8F10A5
MGDVIIVAGVSSSGKSSFIQEELIARRGLPETSVKFAWELDHSAAPQSVEGCVVHYNLLRQLDRNPELRSICFAQQPILTQILSSGKPIEAHLIFAPDDEILRRIAVRKHVEPKFRGTNSGYPSDKIRANFLKVDQKRLLIEFGEMFERAGALVAVWISTNGKFIASDLQSLRSGGL